MKNPFSFIFDLDGTLYGFDKNRTATFAESRFHNEVRQQVLRFLVEKCGVAIDQAADRYQQLRNQYQGQASLAIEKEYGIDRYEYFAQTWDFNPADYVESDKQLSSVLQLVSNRSALLTQAPAIWAKRVLQHLEVEHIFGDRIFTGEPNLRKPDPAIFRLVAQSLGKNPEQIISIGDQLETDILPAKTIGMTTVLIAAEKNNKADFWAPTITAAMNLLKEKGLV